MRGPTGPVSRHPKGDVGWSLVNQLQLTHLSLTEGPPEQAAAALRDTLRLYGPPQDDGLGTPARWHAKPGRPAQVVRRLPFEGPLSFGHGLSITLEVDELAFQGGSAFLLGCALERFFARHAAINSFTELTLRSLQRGPIKRWAPRVGQRETL